MTFENLKFFSNLSLQDFSLGMAPNGVKLCTLEDKSNVNTNNLFIAWKKNYHSSYNQVTL